MCLHIDVVCIFCCACIVNLTRLCDHLIAAVVGFIDYKIKYYYVLLLASGYDVRNQNFTVCLNSMYVYVLQ